MIDTFAITIIAISLGFSAFFSGMEMAYITSDKLKIELLFQKGTFIGKILADFQTNRVGFLATTVVGSNLALVIYGIFMASLLDPWLNATLPVWLADPIFILLIQILLATILVLIAAEFLPKSLFLINPDFLLAFFAVPMLVISYIMYPFVKLVEWISRFFVEKVFGYTASEGQVIFGLTDINNYIKKNLLHDATQEAEVDAKFLHNAIEFKQIKVRDCLIPRTEVVAIDLEDGVEALQQAFIQSGHSKILIYKETTDDIIGYCHCLNMFRKPQTIAEILTPITIVPETMQANELLIKFINEHKGLAVVVDEYGGTSGIVSIEDVIEEIFGEIRDEHDDEFLPHEKIDESTYIFSGRHEIDYINDTYHLGLPEGDYDTLAGYIFKVNEDIPKNHDVIQAGKFHFTIESIADNRIDRVRLTIKSAEETL